MDVGAVAGLPDEIVRGIVEERRLEVLAEDAFESFDCARRQEQAIGEGEVGGVVQRRPYIVAVFDEAARRKGVPGENLIKLLEARLDNTVFRMGISPSRQGARQLVSHKHITVNGEVLNVPSYSCKPGDVIGLNNPGIFAIGDTIYTGGKKCSFRICL